MSRRRSRRGSWASRFSALLLLAIVTVVVWQVWRVVAEDRRERAAWDRVGTCDPVGDTNAVECRGVRLVPLVLSPKIAACRSESTCVVQVNAEALPAFTAALAEVVEADLGATITQFQTVNRRRCRDGTSGAWVPGCVSKHSYGIAVDFRPFADNARWSSVVRNEPAIADVIAIFRSHGFRWGGTFAAFDPQHFEWLPR